MTEFDSPKTQPGDPPVKPQLCTIGRKPPAEYYETFSVTACTTLVVGTVAYTLQHYGLIESDFWPSMAVISMVLEAMSPSWHRLLQYFYPFLLVASTNTMITPLQGVLLIPISLIFVGVCMSVCMHRYFSHSAFETTRAFQFVLGIVSCFAYQAGPIWWAGKHGKHHHHCDQAEDPHSWVVSGFFYSCFGWTFDPHGISDLDLKYINPAVLVPEMFVIERLYMLPVLSLFYYLETRCGMERSDIGYYLLMPMLLCRIWTLIFNLAFHVPRSRRRCKSINLNWMVIAIWVGEAEHNVHHKIPTLAKRNAWDIPYWTTIYWLDKVGLIWNARTKK